MLMIFLLDGEFDNVLSHYDIFCALRLKQIANPVVDIVEKCIMKNCISNYETIH